MPVQRNIAIGQSKSKPVLIDIFTPDKGGGFQTVVFFHGTRGFKDWGAWAQMHHFFNHAGIALVTVNFSHNGIGGQNNDEFTDLKAFAENTISLELQEMKMVLDWLEENAGTLQLNNEFFHLFGHSRAGAEVIVYAGGDKRVDKVIAWAPITDFAEVYRHYDRENWKATGFIETQNARTGQTMPVNYSFIEDVEKNKEAFNVIAAAALLEKPLLLVHGDKDTSVGLDKSNAIYDSCLHALMVTVADADHTFGTSHPWIGGKTLPVPFLEAIDNTIEFIVG